MHFASGLGGDGTEAAAPGGGGGFGASADARRVLFDVTAAGKHVPRCLFLDMEVRPAMPCCLAMRCAMLTWLHFPRRPAAGRGAGAALRRRARVAVPPGALHLAGGEAQRAGWYSDARAPPQRSACAASGCGAARNV